MNIKPVEDKTKICKETDSEVCNTCEMLKICERATSLPKTSTDTEFHRELITEQHSCG